MSEPVNKVKLKRGKKLKPEPHPLAAQIGKLVQYYDNGWRYGYLESINKLIGVVRPPERFNKTGRKHNVPLANIKEFNTNALSSR